LRTNPPAGHRTIRGAPLRHPEPIAWAKRHGLPTARRAWNDQAGEVDAVLAAEGVRMGRKLGCGSFGCAFTDRDHANRVIKVTGDPTEVAAAARVIEARNAGARLPAVVKFYSVAAVRNTDLFIVVQERLLPLKRNEYRMIEEHADAIYDAGLGSAPDRRALAGHLAAQYRVSRSVLRPLLDVFEQLSAIGVEYHDLHEGNVLRTKAGGLRVIDLGISRSKPIRVPQVRP
jgi:hypothetical protein